MLYNFSSVANKLLVRTSRLVSPPYSQWEADLCLHSLIRRKHLNFQPKFTHDQIIPTCSHDNTVYQLKQLFSPFIYLQSVMISVPILQTNQTTIFHFLLIHQAHHFQDQLSSPSLQLLQLEFIILEHKTQELCRTVYRRYCHSSALMVLILLYHSIRVHGFLIFFVCSRLVAQTVLYAVRV